MTIQPDKYYKSKDVRSILNISKTTFFRWMRDGWIKGVRMGNSGHWRIKGSEITRVLNEK